jgi:hypothetical protein
MSAHQTHKTHPHALLAYHQGREDLFGKRERDVLLTLKAYPGSTDREIKTILGLPDMNCVRPRINDLMTSGIIEERGERVDPETGKTVRVLFIKDDPRGPKYRGQIELGAIVKQFTA